MKGAREKAAEAAAEPETEADSDLGSEDKPEGAAGVIGEEESQGASGSSGAEWSIVERSGAESNGAEDDLTLTFVGQGSKAGTNIHVAKYKFKRYRV